MFDFKLIEWTTAPYKRTIALNIKTHFIFNYDAVAFFTLLCGALSSVKMKGALVHCCKTESLYKLFKLPKFSVWL